MHLPVLSERNAVRVAVLLLALSQYATVFDQWWHAAFGRDSFTIPPHLFVYGMSALLVLFSWFAWRQFRTPLWRKLGIVMTILPLSAPFDNFWHATFGVEPVRSLLVAWSPPHVALVLMFFASQYVVLKLIRTYETDAEAKKLLTLFLLALCASSFSFLLMPLQPFNAFHIIGLYGLMVTLPLFVSLALFARRAFGFAGATLFAGFFFARAFAGGIESLEAYAPMSPLLVSAAPMLLATLVLDMVPRTTRIFTQTVIFAGVYAIARVAVFFMFSAGLYSKLQFVLRIDYVVLAFATIVGCLLGGALYAVCEQWYVSQLKPVTIL